MIRVNADRIPIGDFAKKYGLFPFVNHHGLHYYSNSPKGNGLIVAIPDGEVIEALFERVSEHEWKAKRPIVRKWILAILVGGKEEADIPLGAEGLFGT